MKNQRTPKKKDILKNSHSKGNQANSRVIKEEPDQSGLTRGGDPKSKASAPAEKK